MSWAAPTQVKPELKKSSQAYPDEPCGKALCDRAQSRGSVASSGAHNSV